MRGKAFQRSDILYGAESGETFASSSVVVCGAGAVGSFALEALARIGIGRFYIFDFDTVSESNINRQLIAFHSTVGREKAVLAKERIADINPDAKVDVFSEFIDASNCADIIKLTPDVVVDAIDTITSKCALLSACCLGSVPVVSSMGAARRVNPLKVKTAKIFETYACPLAARVRKELRSANIDAQFQCVFSDEQLEPSSHLESGGRNSVKTIGSSPIVTGIFGLALADLAIREILKKKK